METAIDKFSWRRVWLVAKYMFPTLKKQLIMYPAVVVLFTLTGLLFYRFEWLDVTEIGIFNTLCGFLFYFAPVSLARKDNRFVMAQMPVRTSEKFVFLLLYYWIVIGLLTMGLGQVLNSIISSRSLLDIESQKILAEMTGIIGKKMDYIMIMGTFTGLAIQAFALYGVVHAKSNRMITAILYAIAAYVGMSLLSGLIAMFIALFGIWHYKIFSLEAQGQVAEIVAAEFIAELLPTIMTVVSLVLCMVAGVLLYKTYKIIKHRGF